MIRRILATAAGVALLVPAAATQVRAADAGYGFDAGNWALELSGSGSNDNSFDATQVGLSGDLGYFFNDNLELALRQGLTYDDTHGTAWNGTTAIALDWHFDMDRWQPYVGGNFGYVYGDSVSDTFEAAPEVGVKYFLSQTTFLDLRAQYQFFFDSGSGNSGFEDGRFIYSLGMGFKW